MKRQFQLDEKDIKDAIAEWLKVKHGAIVKPSGVLLSSFAGDRNEGKCFTAAATEAA